MCSRIGNPIEFNALVDSLVGHRLAPQAQVKMAGNVNFG